MKKLIYVLLAFVTIVTLPSCEKFLSVDPPYAQDAENFFQTPEDFERALTGAYDLLQSSFVSLWIGEIASDNAIAGGAGSARFENGDNRGSPIKHG